MLGLGLFKVEKLIRVAKAGAAKQQNDKPFNTRTHLTRLTSQDLLNRLSKETMSHTFFFFIKCVKQRPVITSVTAKKSSA